MATLRQFLIDQSTVPQGSTVREHLENPGSGQGLVIGDGIMADFENAMLDAEVSFPTPLQASLEPVLGIEAAIESNTLTAEVDVDELTGEICL